MLTVYGIETAFLDAMHLPIKKLQQHLPFTVLKLACILYATSNRIGLQQYLSFTVCAEGCETAEEQGEDEVRTSQVPEQSEGKTKMIRKWSLPFTVLKHFNKYYMCHIRPLQQCLPFTVCAEGCETAEEQGDDEVRTSLVPE